MNKIDFDSKTFVLIDNSGEGTVNSQTVFLFSQKGTLVTADYHGGPIRSGNIIGRLEGSKLHMLYHCLTDKNELKAGRAVGSISFNDKNKMQLQLQWEWLKSSKEKGTSEYLEI